MKPILKLLTPIALCFIFSCNDEPIDTSTFTAEDPILVDSELYNNIEQYTTDNPENDVVCLEFNYAFTVFIFDEELEFTGLEIVSSDLEFSQFLGSVAEGYTISINYPITYSTVDGETIEITNNEELKDIIEECIDLDEVSYGSGLLTQENCVWNVIPGPDGNDFEGAVFDVSEVGITTFSYNGSVYFGTWITFLIENELHLNITIDDANGEISDRWNFDWKVDIVDDGMMILSNGIDTFVIQKECDPVTCNQFIFEECETELGNEIAEFILEDYIECFTNDIETNNTTITFHETVADMENSINAIVSPYNNLENPQFIYVRIEDNDTGEPYFVSIKIAAVACD